jgi:pyruvate kinase
MSMQAANVTNREQDELLKELSALFSGICQESDHRLAPYRARYPDGFSTAARNLADYLALRSQDLRPLQQRLVNAGLSSLGRGESRVRANLARVIDMLRRASGVEVGVTETDNGSERLATNTARLFGSRNRERYARIMVTLPAAAAAQPELIRQLVDNGIDCARINCAHDDPDTWQRMIGHVRRIEADAGRRIPVFMDLAGHKLRTGPIEPGPAVRHLHVQRDIFGHLTRPARVLLTAAAGTDDSGMPWLPVDAALLAGLRTGHTLHFRDSRDKYRVLQVKEPGLHGGWIAECEANAYVLPGTPLRWQGVTGEGTLIASADFRIGTFPGKPQILVVRRGDHLLLRHDAQAGQCASATGPAQIGCSHPEIVGRLQPGASVWFDDGKLGCVVAQRVPEGVLLRATHAGPRGVRLRSGKGINLPDTELPLPALTDQDLADLDFICAHADIVGFSFVRRLEDIDALRHELAARGKAGLPIVLKIETAAAVKNLPDLLLGTLGKHALGVMIARGDLAIELGSVRMAEIQEEILWICEAAHVPVIWATQVLDSLARKGVIARPEITDAAMSVRAECVMLNKGEYIHDAVSVLDHILTRMDAHQYKKVSRLRQLHW